jgi:hypothetical protein
VRTRRTHLSPSPQLEGHGVPVLDQERHAE